MRRPLAFCAVIVFNAVWSIAFANGGSGGGGGGGGGGGRGGTAPGTQVVDSKGTVVGYIYNAYGPDGGFERQINSEWYLIRPGLLPSGIFASQPSYLYTSKNCSGTTYADTGIPSLSNSPGGLPPLASVTSPKAGQSSNVVVTTATIIYPQRPYQQLPIFSKSSGDVCVPNSKALEAVVGIAGKTTITVVPPLKIQ